MKKKSKILASIFALTTSLCMMVVGVLAASQVGLDVTSSVSFEAKGVYVKVNGEIKTGQSTSSLATATGSGDYKHIGYSYDAVTEQTEDGETATTYDDTPVGTSSNETIPAWTIGEINFDETNKVIQYEFKFKNYSQFDVKAIITNYATAEDSTPALSQTIASLQNKGVTVEESVQGGSITIPAKSQTPGEATYTITLTLNNFASSFDENLSINFKFEKVDPSTLMLTPYEQEINGKTYTFINVGHYPQAYVGDKKNDELEIAYENLQTGTSSDLTATDKEYTRYNAGNKITDTEDEILVCYEYEYEGELYARVPQADLYYNADQTFNDGTTIQNGATYWFKVEPIKWRVLTKNYTDTENTEPLYYLLSEFCLTANTYFDDNSSYSSNYTTSTLNSFLGTTFFNEAFTEEEQSYIKERALTETDLDPYHTIGEEQETTQSVWAPTYYDMTNTSYGFSTNTIIDYERIASATDFAMVNYAYKDTTYQDIHGIGSAAYWLSTAAPSYANALIIRYYGNLIGNSVSAPYADIAIRPAMLFNL